MVVISSDQLVESVIEIREAVSSRILQANESQGTQEVVLDPLHFKKKSNFYLRFNVNSKLPMLYQPAAFSILHYKDIEIHTVDWYILDLGFLDLLQASPHTPVPNFHDHNWQSSLIRAIDYFTLLKSTHVKKARHEQHAFCLVFLFLFFLSNPEKLWCYCVPRRKVRVKDHQAFYCN